MNRSGNQHLLSAVLRRVASGTSSSPETTAHTFLNTAPARIPPSTLVLDHPLDLLRRRTGQLMALAIAWTRTSRTFWETCALNSCPVARPTHLTHAAQHTYNGELQHPRSRWRSPRTDPGQLLLVTTERCGSGTPMQQCLCEPCATRWNASPDRLIPPVMMRRSTEHDDHRAATWFSGRGTSWS